MSDIVERALELAAKGDDAVLAGFGVERYRTLGTVIRGASEYEERLSLLGSGEARCFVRRSFAEMPGDEVGEYRKDLPRSRVAEVVAALRDAKLARLEPFRIEPYEQRLRLGVVAGGGSIEAFIGATDPGRLEPLRPLLEELDAVARECRAGPVATLQLDADLPGGVGAGKSEVKLGLRLHNSGSAGYWITNPAAGGQDGETERLGLTYVRKPELRPDRAPPIITPVTVPLRPAEKDDRPLVWVAPRGEVRFAAVAALDLPEKGDYVVKATFVTHAGEDTVGGQRRMRGGVTSAEAVLEVGS